MWTADGKPIAFLWVRFSGVPDYNLVIAEIDDIAVVPEYHGQGIGKQLLEYAEATARQRGANVLRSETSIENIISHKLHKKQGLEIYRLRFEKLLSHPVKGEPSSKVL